VKQDDRGKIALL